MIMNRYKKNAQCPASNGYHNTIFSLSILALSFFSSACSSDDKAPMQSVERDSWQIIQEDVLASNCVGCHTAGTAFSRQSDLVLTPDIAYEQLLNTPPHNSAAREDGLVRLSDEGLPGLYKSYLWEKIYAQDQQHFYADHPQYGALMPLGGQVLTSGQLAFVRQWIEAGAPEVGAVADPALLADQTQYQVPVFAAPPVPENGIQLHLGPFDVAANFEREFFYAEELGNTEDIFVEGFDVAMRGGSHHLLVYTFHPSTPSARIPQAQQFRELRDASGNYVLDTVGSMLFHMPIIGSQFPFMSYHFPPGIALRLPAGTLLDLNSHYVNRTDETLQGEVYANLHLVEENEIEREAQILFLNNLDLRLPAGKTTTVEREFRFAEDRHIIQLMSHAHEHMTEFRIEVIGGARDGELLYIAYNWEHPPILELDPPLRLEAGQGLRLVATYDNWTDRELGFGFLSEDEMMILYGFYYEP